ncbi:MAG: hypothetical protein J5711_02220 [Bacteroidales bacterium]|nr:hypothetical protein [Bacteroidales bacterium]
MKSKKEKTKMDGIEFAKMISDSSVPLVIDESKPRNRYHMYGSIKAYDKLVDSSKVSDRLKAIELGYGIEKLMDDASVRVRHKVEEYIRENKKKIYIIQ